MSGEREVEVFAIGADAGWLSVKLPLAWAKEHCDVEVIFSDDGEEFGWHARLESGDGEHLMSFPWHDHVDRMLRGEAPQELPIELDEHGSWSDLEQGWWASATQVGNWVYLAQSDFKLSTVSLGAPARQKSQGVAEVDGIEISWNAVPAVAYGAAWRAAIEACSAGEPQPRAE